MCMYCYVDDGRYGPVLALLSDNVIVHRFSFVFRFNMGTASSRCVGI